MAPTVDQLLAQPGRGAALAKVRCLQDHVSSLATPQHPSVLALAQLHAVVGHIGAAGAADPGRQQGQGLQHAMAGSPAEAGEGGAGPRVKNHQHGHPSQGSLSKPTLSSPQSANPGGGSSWGSSASRAWGDRQRGCSGRI